MPDHAQPFEHALEKLEFDQIRRRLQRFAISGLGEAMVAACTPITDRVRLEREHARVAEMRCLLESEDSIPIQDIRDVRSSLKRCTVANTRLDPLEFVELLHTLQASRALRSYFSTHRDLSPLLQEFTESLFVDKLLERHIELTVDGTGRLLDTASKRLRQLREDIIAHQEMLRKQCAKILRAVADKDFTQDDILTQRDGRMVIPLKAEHKRKISGVVHSVSQTGQTVFVEPTETLELNNDIVALQFEEQKEIGVILRELTDRVRDQAPALQESIDILREVEFVYIRARYSLDLNAVPAQFTDSTLLTIMNARHPLLIAHHGIKNVQPMTVELGDSVTTLVISGPNAGGKSIALKTIGLLALMAQSGIHLPADPGTTLPVFDEVFVDLGDDQSIENDLSTFSSHLRTVKDILWRSTDRSLVLIDEIGMGTDPNEGGALAMSVLSALTSKHVVTVVTTHHGALKSFAHDTAGVENAGMEFDLETLAPTYKMRVGRPGSSYAFEIARTLELPEAVLEDAVRRLGTQQVRLEHLLHDLESSLQSTNKERHQLEDNRVKAEALRIEYEQKLSHSTRDARETLRAAKAEARALLEEARALIEKTVQELRVKDKDQVRVIRETFQKAQRQIVTKSSEVVTAAPPPEMPTWRVGETVALADSNAVGTLLTVPDSRGVVQVQLGGMKVTAKADQLRSASSKEKRKSEIKEARIVTSPDVPHKLDLRGKYGDEALAATDLYIAEAAAAGYEKVEIIHGMGTGVLRKVVHAFLKNHPQVLSFSHPEYYAGGTGVTIVELKQ